MILKHINITYARHRVESARLTYLGLVNHENDYVYIPLDMKSSWLAHICNKDV